MSIPNTLTIFINTNIRGSNKLIYKPSMTVPNISNDKKNESVNFDPIIKYYKKIIDDIPINAPKEEKYTQFFKKNLFQSFISKTIANTNQPKGMTLYKATQSGFIDNNIKLTLDTLFKENTPFYIKGKEYIINDYSWIKGDWRIDTKRIEKRFFINPYNPYLNTINFLNKRV